MGSSGEKVRKWSRSLAHVAHAFVVGGVATLPPNDRAVRVVWERAAHVSGIRTEGHGPLFPIGLANTLRGPVGV